MENTGATGEKAQGDQSHRFEILRRQARRILEAVGAEDFHPDRHDVKKLFEELNIYQIELELQNEELQQVRDRLETAQTYLESIFSQAPVGYLVLSEDGLIRKINNMAAAYFGLEKPVLIGQRLQSFVPHDRFMEYNACFKRLREERAPQNTEVQFRVKQGHNFWARMDLHRIDHPEEGDRLILCSLLDITRKKRDETLLRELTESLEDKVRVRTRDLASANERLRGEVDERRHAQEKLRESLREKEALLKEIHHRVKNNLQMMTSLLRLQSRKFNDPGSAEIFSDTQNRIQSMAIVHEILYETATLDCFNPAEYIERIVNALRRLFAPGHRRIRFDLEIDRVWMPIRFAIPMGMVINELITNTCKHAFPAARAGDADAAAAEPLISLSLKKTPPAGVALRYHDNGVGLPDDLDPSAGGGVGLRMVREMAIHQLGGPLEAEQGPGCGFVIRMAEAGS